MPTPWAVFHPGIMDLAAVRTALTQNGFTPRANQPPGDNPFVTFRACTGQGYFRVGRLIKLHADEVENDGEAENKKQKHR